MQKSEKYKDLEGDPLGERHLIRELEEHKHYEEMLKKDPERIFRQALKWDDLPFPPCFEQPQTYVPFISRTDWGAQPMGQGAEPLTNPIMYVRFTYLRQPECHSVDECSDFMRRLQKISKDKGLPDIPYNFIVGGKGIIYEGRGWEWESEREQAYNDMEEMHGKLKGQTVDIAYVGDLSVYLPLNEEKMGAATFVLDSMRKNLIHRMVQTIPIKRITDFDNEAAYYQVKDGKLVPDDEPDPNVIL